MIVVRYLHKSQVVLQAKLLRNFVVGYLVFYSVIVLLRWRKNFASFH